jgi:8-oxo-dGTP pyrophosphatase MutT (NUDIX family)
MSEQAEPRVRLLSRKLMCENSVFKIYFDSLEGERGYAVGDYLVVYPKVRLDANVTGISVLPVMEGMFGLLRVYRHAVGTYLWEIPRGFVSVGESEVAAAARELKEETGLECTENDMMLLGSVMHEPGVISGKNRLYAGLNCIRASSYRVTELGHKEFHFFTPQEYYSLITNEQIQDPSSIISYYRFMEMKH